MKSKIFQDENHCYQFDFTDAIWVTDELHDTFQKNKASILSDVDFIFQDRNFGVSAHRRTVYHTTLRNRSQKREFQPLQQVPI